MNKFNKYKKKVSNILLCCLAIVSSLSQLQANGSLWENPHSLNPQPTGKTIWVNINFWSTLLTRHWLCKPQINFNFKHLVLSDFLFQLKSDWEIEEDKGSHPSKNTGILWNTFIKRRPPPRTAFMKSLFRFSHWFWVIYYFGIRDMKSGWPPNFVIKLRFRF